MRSWRPFCCGDAGAINSGRMPSRIHQTDNVDSRPSAVVAKGTPLSVRMIPGKPYSWKRWREDRPGRGDRGREQSVAGQQVPAEAIDECERNLVGN